MSSIGKIFGPAVHPKVKRAQATAQLAGLKLEHVPVSLMAGDHKKPEYLAKFPFGKVPAFEAAQGWLLVESRAIARYIAGLNPNAQLLGADPHSAALVEQWICFSDDEIFAAGSKLFGFTRGVVPYSKPAEQKALETLDTTLAYVEKHLHTQTFLVGHRITLADVTLAANLRFFYSEIGGKEYRDRYPNLFRHFNTVTGQPAIKDLYADTVLRDDTRSFAPPKVEKPKAAPAPKPAKAPKAAAAGNDEDDDDEPKPAPKVKNPLDDLPKSSFNMEDWKRIYSNKDTYKEALPWFYENFDAEGYSIWRFDYKYNDELTQIFMSSNLIGGFFSRLEASRKYIMGAAGVFGENNASAISGVVVLRGQDWVPVLSVAPDIDSYSVSKVDLKDAVQKKYFEDVLAWEAELDGKKWADGKQLK